MKNQNEIGYERLRINFFKFYETCYNPRQTY